MEELQVVGPCHTIGPGQYSPCPMVARRDCALSMAKSTSRCKMTVIGAPKLGILRRSPNLLFLLKSAVTSRYIQQVSPRWIVLIVALFVAACVLHAPSIGNLMCRNHTISRLMRGLIIHGCGFIPGSRAHSSDFSMVAGQHRVS
jgi:hypothetical protein